MALYTVLPVYQDAQNTFQTDSIKNKVGAGPTDCFKEIVMNSYKEVTGSKGQGSDRLAFIVVNRKHLILDILIRL